MIYTVDDQDAEAELNKHDDEVATLMFHIQHLITHTSSVPTFTPDTHKSGLEKAANRRGCLDYNVLLTL